MDYSTLMLQKVKSLQYYSLYINLGILVFFFVVFGVIVSISGDVPLLLQNGNKTLSDLSVVISDSKSTIHEYDVILDDFTISLAKINQMYLWIQNICNKEGITCE